MNEKTRRGFHEEIQRLRKEIFECPHCDARRERIIEIINVMPPDPFIVAPGGVYQMHSPLTFEEK